MFGGVDAASSESDAAVDPPRFTSTVRRAALLIDVLRAYMLLNAIAFVAAAVVTIGALDRYFTVPPYVWTMLLASFALARWLRLPALLVGYSWIRRAYGNQRALGHEPRRLVRFWFLIPVLNLVRAYQMIRDMWDTSVSRGAPGDRRVVVAWGVAIHAALVIGPMIAFIYVITEQSGGGASVQAGWLGAAGLHFAAAWLGIAVVRGVTVRQELAVPARASGALLPVVTTPEAENAVALNNEAESNDPYRGDPTRARRITVRAQTVTIEGQHWFTNNDVIDTAELRNVIVRRELPWSVLARQRYALFARTRSGEVPLLRRLLPGEAHAARSVLRELIAEPGAAKT